jgi:hypothetical protein
MNYPKTSPYYNTTTVNSQFLDVMNPRKIPASSKDNKWTITTTYNMRPDLLANDLYGDARLWWVFAQRNPNELKDPLFDFTTGTTIYVPQPDAIRATLGL